MNLLTYIFDHLAGVKNGTKIASEVTPVFKQIATAATATAEQIAVQQIATRTGIAPTKEGVADYVINLVDQHTSDPVTADLLNTYLSSQLLGSASASPIAPSLPGSTQSLPGSAIAPPPPSAGG